MIWRRGLRPVNDAFTYVVMGLSFGYWVDVCKIARMAYNATPLHLEICQSYFTPLYPKPLS